MSKRVCTRLLMFVALSAAAFAQTGAPAGGGMSQGTATLMIRVEYENGRPVPGVQVTLLSEFGQMTDARSTDGTGAARFQTQLGRYKVHVSGPTIEARDSDYFELSTPGPGYTERVSVKAVPPRDSANGVSVDARAAVDLNVPDRARKEFEKGVDDVQHKNWPSARGHFEKATEIYPKYAMAYNDLALAFLNLGEAEKAVESFRTALQYDEHMQQANLYLGRLYYENKRFKDAEPYLARAAADQPRDPQILTALANTELRNGETDQALATAQKVHSLPDHQKFAVAHIIAGDILLDRNRGAAAMQEYKMFLAEDPQSPLAPRVQQELAKLQNPTK
jgi:tetratricopeptide (TPR) repeat protein